MLVQAAASIRLRIGRVPVLGGCVWFERGRSIAVTPCIWALWLAVVRRWWRRPVAGARAGSRRGLR